MTEMQAAIGRIQLGLMTEWMAKRADNANRIANALLPFADESGPIRLPVFPRASYSNAVDEQRNIHAHYKYYAYVRPGNLATGWNRDRIVEEIVSRGVPCFQGSCSEVYLELAFDGTGWRPETQLPVAKDLGETSLMFLVHPTLVKNEMDAAVSVVQEVIGMANGQVES